MADPLEGTSHERADCTSHQPVLQDCSRPVVPRQPARTLSTRDKNLPRNQGEPILSNNLPMQQVLLRDR